MDPDTTYFNAAPYNLNVESCEGDDELRSV